MTFEPLKSGYLLPKMNLKVHSQNTHLPCPYSKYTPMYSLKKSPVGLPPKRGIQHHIDLIPVGILPNELAYRMNPKYTMKIQRQVEELVSKGLVQESLNPLSLIHI